jgi:hypothetical protein
VKMGILKKIHFGMNLKYGEISVMREILSIAFFHLLIIIILIIIIIIILIIIIIILS